MSQALTLYRLQQIDSQTDRARARLDIVQKTLEDDASLKQAIQQAESAAAEQSAAEGNQKQADAEVQALRVKIEQTESSLYSGAVRNPKELQDLQNEAAALKRHLITLEDRLLEAMLATESAQDKNKRAQALLAAAQSNWTEQNQSFSQEQAGLLKDIQKLNTERLAITGSLAAEQFGLYEQLRQQRGGLAVTNIQENTCGACGTTLTPALVQAARSSGQMSRCPTCGRILFGN
ncbi:MAG: hypothetical protein HY781_12415 [Chloroflexi bacterium]|nr:hypothetical protein [Chloroflexota bacterium]